MHSYRFQDVRVVFVEPNSEMRLGLKAALRDHGFNNIMATGNIDHLEEAIRNNEADLIIGDVHFQGRSICEMVKSLRHSQMGDNPFSVTMALTSNPVSSNIAQCINAGFDDILLKPLTVNQMMDRIINMIESRKPFVVTHDYIGPDRRNLDRPCRPNAVEIPQLIVPNPLRARAKDGMTTAELHRQIVEAKKEINEQRIERYEAQIDWLVARVVPCFLYDRVDDDCLMMLMRLEVIAQDLSRRLEGSNWQHISNLCDGLRDVIERINMDPEHPSSKDIDLLPNLATAIRAAFKADEEGVAMAEDISKQVRTRDLKTASAE